MTATFETFMSEVGTGDTRTDEMRAEWEKQNPGKKYPESNLVGEQVGTPEGADTKKKEIPATAVDYSVKIEGTREKLAVELAKPDHRDWPPAVGNPEAEQALSKDLEAGMNTL